MHSVILAYPVKLTLGEISQVYVRPQTRCSVLCIITPADGPFEPKHVVYH
jgi:hypothetical protein